MWPLKRLSCIALLVTTPSGCVIDNSRVLTQNYSQVIYQVEANTTDSSRVEQAAVQPPPQVIVKTIASPTPEKRSTACQSFILPRAGLAPLPPNLEDPKYRNSAELDTAIAGYVKTLRDFIISERDILEDAYAQWMENCGR